jgi:hypothetical protein
MVNSCNKDNAVINRPSHAVTDADKKLLVTTKPEVLQTSFGSPHKEGNTTSNTSDEAL